MARPMPRFPPVTRTTRSLDMKFPPGGDGEPHQPTGDVFDTPGARWDAGCAPDERSLVSDNNPDGSTPVPPAQPAPPAYAQPPAYDAPPAYGTQPIYGTQPTYGTEPAYGSAPAYGTAPAYGSPYGGYAPAKTNTLAIVSLVSSLVGLFILPFIGSIVGVITGHMSLSQIKKTGEQGRGLAFAGTIIGYVGLAFIVLGLIVFLAFLPILFASINNSA